MSDVTRVHSADKEPAPRPVLERPPGSFRPDRNETETSVGLRTTGRIDHGVNFTCLVARFNEARNLTMSLVTMDPCGKLRYHTHLFAESVTLLSGLLDVDVEVRRYSLRAMDNVVIPRGLAQAAQNASPEQTVPHIAMASSTPTRMPANKVIGSLAVARFEGKNR